FTGLPSMPSGTGYAIREISPSGWTQTYPLASAPNTMVMPDGLVGYVVPGDSGVPMTTQNGQSVLVSGNGTLTLNAASGPAITLYRNNGTQSGTISTTAGPFDVTWTDSSNNSNRLNSLCIDMFHFVGIGQSWAASVRDDLATHFTNGPLMGYMFQKFFQPNMTQDEASGLQIAEWDASLNNHTPTYIAPDSFGNYNSGDPGIFNITSLGGNAANIIYWANKFFTEASAANPSTVNGFFDSSAGGGQDLILPTTQYTFGDVNSVSVPANTPADCD